MSLFNHDELFHKSGPQGMLNYLQSKLDSRDLSSEEALALLSALHEELGQAKAADPHLYQAYSRFMDSLQKTMPQVHEYVVSTWGHVHDRHASESASEVPDEIGDSEIAPRELGTEIKEGVAEARMDDLQESVEGEEFGEAGQPESEGADREEMKEESTQEEREETGDEDEAEDREEEKRDEEDENIKPEELEETDEVESPVAEESEQEQEEETEGDETEADESGAVGETESEAGEAEAETGGAEAEPEIESGGHEEMEWPQMEELEEEEPMEGEEGSSSPVD